MTKNKWRVHVESRTDWYFYQQSTHIQVRISLTNKKKKLNKIHKFFCRSIILLIPALMVHLHGKQQISRLKWKVFWVLYVCVVAGWKKNNILMTADTIFSLTTTTRKKNSNLFKKKIFLVSAKKTQNTKRKKHLSSFFFN